MILSIIHPKINTLHNLRGTNKHIKPNKTMTYYHNRRLPFNSNSVYIHVLKITKPNNEIINVSCLGFVKYITPLFQERKYNNTKKYTRDIDLLPRQPYWTRSNFPTCFSPARIQIVIRLLFIGETHKPGILCF